MLRKFLRDENGATAIEYSLIAGFIALAIIAAVGMTGQRLLALFEEFLIDPDRWRLKPCKDEDCEAGQDPKRNAGKS